MTYNFSGAGSCPSDYDYNVFVKYEKSNLTTVDCSHFSISGSTAKILKLTDKVWVFKSNDRIVYITKSCVWQPDDFDVYLNTNPYRKNNMYELDIPWILFSAHNWKRDITEYYSNKEFNYIADCMHIEELLPTVNGIKSIADFIPDWENKSGWQQVPEFSVYTPEGTGLSEKIYISKKERTIWELATDRGAIFKTSKNHKFLVLDAQFNIGLAKVKDIKAGDYILAAHKIKTEEENKPFDFDYEKVIKSEYRKLNCDSESIKKTLDYLLKNNLYPQKVVKVEKLKEKSRVWDFYIHKKLDKRGKEIENDHLYLNRNATVHHQSGGAQLRFGTTSYIDPVKIAEAYNKIKPTYGVILDIPPTADDMNPEYLAILAKIQKENCAVFKKHCDPNLKFLNAFHGAGVFADEWVDTVDDEFFCGWAIAFSSSNMFLNWLSTCSLILNKTKTGKEHFHILGRGSKTLMPLMAWLGKDLCLSADSSNHVFTGVKGREYQFWTPDGKFLYNRYGTVVTEKIAKKGKKKEIYKVMPYNNQMELPCACNLCHHVKFAEIFAQSGMERLIGIHDLYSAVKYSQWWTTQAEKTSSLGKYMELIKKFCVDHEWLNEQLKFLDYCLDKGIRKTKKKYSSWLKEPKATSLQKFKSDDLTLFGGDKHKARLENISRKNATVKMSAPYYLDYTDLQHVMSKEEYISAKIKMYQVTLPKSKREIKINPDDISLEKYKIKRSTSCKKKK